MQFWQFSHYQSRFMYQQHFGHCSWYFTSVFLVMYVHMQIIIKEGYGTVTVSYRLFSVNILDHLQCRFGFSLLCFWDMDNRRESKCRPDCFSPPWMASFAFPRVHMVASSIFHKPQQATTTTYCDNKILFITCLLDCSFSFKFINLESYCGGGSIG